MNAVLLLFRVVLSAVFATAGVAKLFDPQGSENALRGFGVPEWLAKPSARLLPLAELAVAVALFPMAWAPWGAWGALGLLVLFSLAIAVTLARGNAPDCHCFGQLHSEPVSSTTLIRNLLLAACAGALLWFGPGASAGAWLDQLNTAETAIFTVVLGALLLFGIQSWIMFQMMQQNGRILTRLSELEAGGGKKPAPEPPPPAGLPVGTEAPAFSLQTLAGDALSLGDLLLPAKPLMLLFTDPNCGPCGALLPDIARWDKEARAHFSVVLISRGTAEVNREKLAQHPVRTVLLQTDREVAEAFEAQATPTAVMVEADGTIGSLVAVGGDAIKSLAARAINSGLVNIQIKAGDIAPVFTLPAIDGEMVSSSAFRGKPAMFLFWNPGCGFCMNMLPDLKRWEAKRSKADPEVVLIATGSLEANRGYGLRSRVLFDESASVSKIFNASGTPTAVLVDPDGRLISEVAIGSVAALELASSLRPGAKAAQTPVLAGQ